jgi:hypothetical protein
MRRTSLGFICLAFAVKVEEKKNKKKNKKKIF